MTVTEIKGAEIKGADAETDEETTKTGRGRKLLVLLLVVALLGAGAWFLLLRGGGQEEPKPGEVVALEATQINLAGGHYLKIGIALQLVEGAHEIDGSKALDATIDLFSGRDVAEIGKAATRNTLKHKLSEELAEHYHGEVMEVYFTEFVTQ